MDGLVIKRVETEAEREAAIGVRFRVFVDEQSVPPEEELDQADATATHAIALYLGQVVGTGRLIRLDADTPRLGGWRWIFPGAAGALAAGFYSI